MRAIDTTVFLLLCFSVYGEIVFQQQLKLASIWQVSIFFTRGTAISKSIGIGLARYCELVEQKFSKEMDRLTPEQEAAMNQTRQEKWISMAKDFYSQKEKIEPFQFWPEVSRAVPKKSIYRLTFEKSLIKLNNIEYAMHRLDKLEHEINVDACAEVISKHART